MYRPVIPPREKSPSIGYTHSLGFFSFLSLIFVKQASEPTTPLQRLAKMVNSQCFSHSTSQQHLTQVINLPPFLKHFLHWDSRTSLAISTLPTSLAAPSLISSQVSSPTLTLSPGPLLSTHYLDDLMLSHGFNAGKPQSPVSNQTSSLPPDSLIQLPTQHLHLDIYEAFLI